MNAIADAGELSMLIATSAKPCRRYRSWTASRSSISSLQAVHQLAQILSSTTFPFRSFRDTFCPLTSPGRTKSGTGLPGTGMPADAGEDTVQASRNARVRKNSGFVRRVRKGLRSPIGNAS